MGTTIQLTFDDNAARRLATLVLATGAEGNAEVIGRALAVYEFLWKTQPTAIIDKNGDTIDVKWKWNEESPHDR